ncbi:GlmU family protein [Pontibacter akesuensis]|uniref:UDP-N-acetylglucosamine diphosphorylase/glucosamine-1-phosphate N-acetyltransferase n=1 Tax=Pontibacter akesuensis TaxID=388950 RepID=A0A1I7JEK3_9BACT|nr:GlmU family protein [Pontibacter akesuensis]GHA70516.1 glucose-1-phosphate thymidylyltransferase [Pontibacter akesuensis]SFU83590.1 UDP-N-acetylglucosamine diphosphorylase/glucosamine-1-phosphate N-acetyltransferase [Pontibacter akesuensis]
MNIILFDAPAQRQNLLPLTFTRPVGQMRVGILTIAEKWAQYMGASVSCLTQPYLQQKYPLVFGTHNLYINGAVCPDEGLVAAIRALKEGEALYHNSTLIALNGDNLELQDIDSLTGHSASGRQEYGSCILINDVWDIFLQNGDQIRSDFKLLTNGRQSQPIGDKHTIVYNEENIFIEEGAQIRAAVLNAENGPIYIGKNAQVQEGSLIRGPFALCEESHVNMGAKMRGDVTVGPYSKVGGEVAASVIFGYSNKGHEGYLGNSVLGEWCNLGADTNTSNLKNNYAEVKIWNYAKGGFKNTGQQFCGLIMGDHSKCGINTMFNTGTVVGVSANIFGAGFPRNFIPSFSWGGAAGFETFQMRKVVEVAEKVMARRKLQFDEVEKSILAHIFEETKQYRVWDKKTEEAKPETTVSNS